MPADGPAKKATIYVNEDARHHFTPLPQACRRAAVEAILKKLRELGSIRRLVTVVAEAATW